jgi:hypothetical protein
MSGVWSWFVNDDLERASENSSAVDSKRDKALES